MTNAESLEPIEKEKNEKPIICIIGPSGIGKDALINHIGLENVSVGQYIRDHLIEPNTPEDSDLFM